MASGFEKGESVYFLFRNGYTVRDGQMKPRYYLTRKTAERYADCDDQEIVEYAPLPRWISVTEQLPYRTSCNGGKTYSEAVIVLTSGRKVMVGVWDGTDWIVPFDFWEAWGEEITHWMPLPKLPKETVNDG